MSTSISTRLIKVRKERKLSQKDAAKALGVSQALLSHYEKGIRECGLDFLCKAALFYDVSTDYLLGLSETQTASDRLFDMSATVNDGDLQMDTVFKAAVLLYERLSSCGVDYSERVRAVYVLTIYRLYICAVEQGLVQKEKSFGTMLHSYISSGILDGIIASIPQEDSKSESCEPLPLCIDTVIHEAMHLIREKTKLIN